MAIKRDGLGGETDERENNGLRDILGSRGLGAGRVAGQWSGKTSEEVTPE